LPTRRSSDLAWLEVRLGRYHDAVVTCETGDSWLERADDAAGMRFATHTLASAHYKAGNYADAGRLFTDLAERAGGHDDLLRAEALGRLGLVAQATGDYDEARERYEDALRANRALENVGGVVTQLLNLGALDLNSSAPERAAARFEEGLALARAHGYEQIVPVLLHNLANVRCKEGRHALARALAEEALERVIASGERGLESGMLATLGWIALEAGEVDVAEERARAALRVALEIRDEPAEQTARVRLGQVLAARGCHPEASRLLEAAIAHPATLTWARRLAERLRETVPRT